jgi:hypothetical protein
MRNRASLLGVSCALCLSSSAAAQQQRQPTVVQLPSFSFFTVSTTVSVPDSARGFGRVYAGGIKSAASGRNEFGPPFLPGNVGIGQEARAAGMTVSAQIHDLHDDESWMWQPELRDARLKERLAQANARQQRDAQVEEALAKEPGRSAPIRSVAAIRQEREQKAEAEQAEALALLDRGRKCEAEGKPGAAKVYYEMAARRATGELRTQVVARLRELAAERTNSSSGPK